jgi:hypothetical protein
MGAVLRRAWSRSPGMVVFTFLVLAVAAIASLSALGGDGGDSATTAGTSPAEAAGSSYAQSWPRDYTSTTCHEFLNEMTARQQFAASADMLASARVKGDGGAMPTNALILAFESGLKNACPVVPGLALAEAGAGLYLTERARFAP